MALSSKLRIRLGRCLRLRVQQGEGALIRLRLVEGRKAACEKPRGFDQIEQGQAGPQLERIDRTEDLLGAALAGPPQQDFDRLTQSRPEHRMRQISSRLFN